MLSWFAGYRMRAFAAKGVVSDISDVWADSLGDMSEGFKSASTGRDGNVTMLERFTREPLSKSRHLSSCQLRLDRR